MLKHARYLPAISGVAIAVAAAMLSLTSQAQNLPGEVLDAGRLLGREQAVLPEPRFPKRDEIDTPLKPPADAGRMVYVRALRVQGSTVFTEEELLDLIIDDAEGRELSIGDLYALAERITQHYRKNGYTLARAYVPAQPVRDGLVVLSVIEGRLGEISIRNHAGIKGLALAPVQGLRKGELAQDETLERALLLLSDVPGIKPESTLRAGSSFGLTDLIVDVNRAPWITGMIDADMNGDRYNGRNRLGVALNLNNALGLGDQFGVRTRISDGGFRYALGTWRVPVSRNGMQLSTSVSDLRYEPGGELTALGISGGARTYGFALTQPIVRTRRTNVYTEVELSNLSVEDRVAVAGSVRERLVNRISASLSGDWVDDWGGSNSWSVVYAMGNLDTSIPPNPADVTAAREGRFSKVNLSLRRLQALSSDTSLLLSVTAQLARQNLDSSQKFALGGSAGVRAYPQGEGFGDEGLLSVIELRQLLGAVGNSTWQGTAFIDHGQVRLSKVSAGNTINERTLTGAGLGLNASIGDGWGLRTSVAWRVGTQAPLTDEDKNPRLWMQASKNF